MMGDEGPKGYGGPPGPAGPPGPPGDTGGFDAAQLSQIFGNQNKGPSQADDPHGKVQKDTIQVSHDVTNKFIRFFHLLTLKSFCITFYKD